MSDILILIHHHVNWLWQESFNIVAKPRQSKEVNVKSNQFNPGFLRVPNFPVFLIFKVYKIWHYVLPVVTGSAHSLILTLRRPLHKKFRMKWFFDISKVKESSFIFKSDLTDPPQIFDAHLLENTDLSPSKFHFSVGLISRSSFESNGFIAYSNEWDWRQKKDVFHTKKP